MASGGSGAAQGAKQGALAGSVVPGWGTLIGGVIGGIGGYFGGIAARGKEREMERLEEKIQNILSVKKFNKLFGKFLPIFRSQIAAGVGPAIQQQTAGQISARGLSGTGLGEVLQSLSVVAPGIEATRQAGEMARNTQIQRARAVGAQISRKAMTTGSNPILEALSGAAGGAFSGYEMDEAAGGKLGFPKTSHTGLFTDQDDEDHAFWLMNNRA